MKTPPNQPDPHADIHRTLPHSEEAEQGVLGSILLDSGDTAGEMFDQGSEKFFYFQRNALIFTVLKELWTEQKPFDFIVLTEVLHSRGKLEEVGGPAYCTHLFTFTPTWANAEYYLEIIREKYVLRGLIQSCTEVVEQAYNERGEVTHLLDRAEASVLSIRETTERAQPEPLMKDEVMSAIESIQKLYENKGKITGLPSGFTKFDQMTNGLNPTDMIVIAARPSMGKSALAVNIAEHVAIVQKKSVAIFSLEMSTQQLVQRLLCSRARVNLQKVRDGFLSERDFPNLTAAAGTLAGSRIHIDDRAALSILQIRAKARRWKKQHDIALIVIDYLQLVKSLSKRGQDNRQLEVAEVSSGIKGLAKELKIPIVVLAQLNRNPEGRGGGVPKLGDLRESGSIEADADVVGLLHRAEYYADGEEAKAQVRGEAVLDIAKNRNGPVGEVKLTFLKEYTRFEDRADEGDQDG